MERLPLAPEELPDRQVTPFKEPLAEVQVEPHGAKPLHPARVLHGGQHRRLLPGQILTPERQSPRIACPERLIAEQAKSHPPRPIERLPEPGDAPARKDFSLEEGMPDRRMEAKAPGHGPRIHDRLQHDASSRLQMIPAEPDQGPGRLPLMLEHL